MTQADWVKENTNKASEEASSVSGSEVQPDYTSYYKNRGHGMRIHLVDSKGLYVESRLMTPDDIKKIESLAQQRTEKKCDDLKDYCVHQTGCPLAYWEAGRPTNDGGYETN